MFRFAESSLLKSLILFSSCFLLEISLVNVLGTTIEINPTNESIDRSDINSGIYFLSIKTSKGIMTKKIVRF